MAPLCYKSKIVLGLLVQCLFNRLFFVEAYPNFLPQTEQKPAVQLFLPRSEDPNFMRKIGNKNYLVRFSFSRSSPINDTTTTEKSAINTNENYMDTLYYDSDLDSNDTFSLICDDVEFECKSDQSCISLESYCDGEKDCEDNSDEQMCAVTPIIHFSIINDTTTISSETPSITSNNDSDVQMSATKPTIDFSIVNDTIKPTTTSSEPLSITNDSLTLLFLLLLLAIIIVLTKKICFKFNITKEKLFNFK